MAADRPELEPLVELFPLRCGAVEIYLVDRPPGGHHSNPDEIWAPVQMVFFEAGSITDILEQDVMLAPHPNLLADPDRVRNCIDAHVEVLTELFARPRGPYDSPNYPADMMFLSDLLTLRKASSREEFVAALRARKRLGKRLS
jgi:hypothetical protein